MDGRYLRNSGRCRILIVPGLGPLVIIGPFAATLLGGVEGAIAGGAIGGLAPQAQ